jgi:hypothetical protein
MLPRRGVIFVQDLSVSPLVSRVSSLNLQASINLASSTQCGDVLIVTTKWDKMTQEEGELAETAMMDRVWNKVLHAGFHTFRIRRGREGESSLSAIQHFLQITPEQQRRNLEVLQSRLYGSSPAPPHLRFPDSMDELCAGCGRCGDVIVLWVLLFIVS